MRGHTAAGDAGQAAGVAGELSTNHWPSDLVRICHRTENGKILEFGTVGTKLASAGMSVLDKSPRSKTCDGCKSCLGSP